MSLIQTVSSIKDDALNSIVCPVVIRLGVQSIPAASLLVGEVTLSGFLHYGVILPSPIGVELLEFPSRMVCVLQRRRFVMFQASRVPKKFLSFFQRKSLARG